MNGPYSDRPMTDYERALSGIVRVMLDTMIDMGAPKSQLAHGLKTLKDSAQLDGHHTEAAMIELTMRNAGLR
ncbi:MAG: hypothetical protein ACXWK2_00895 [Rhizomicrobium sp.]